MTSNTPPAQPDTLATLLLRWQELRDEGKACQLEEICAEQPELLSELRRQVKAIESMERLLTDDGPRDRPTLVGATMVRGAGPPPSSPPGYELLNELGRGGMGVVYKARQVSLNRLVALKMVLAGGHAAPRQRARFKSEAEALARLSHPNIVQIHEIGEHEGLPFFSLEFVDGGNLAERLSKKPLAPTEAAELIRRLALAVSHAHAQGIIHRDLKPANVLLQDAKPQAAIPKITDFGLAKLLDSDSQTNSGAVMGTPSYMAPEQASGKVRSLGPGVDVYALGAILYECLTGEPPFRSESVLGTLQQVATQAPVPPSRLAKIPADLEVICLKCLHKEPERRYVSGAELADDLQRFLDGRPIRARRVSMLERGVMWVRRRPERALLIGVLVIALGVLAFDFWPRPKVDPEPDLPAQARNVLRRYCFTCHGFDPKAPEGELDILKHDDLLQADHVVPGDIKRSLLIKRIEDNSMPPEEADEHPRMSSDEVSILKRWIEAGAPPFEPAQPKDYQPPPRPSPLTVEVKQIFKQHCFDCHSRNDKEKRLKVEKGLKILNHDLLVNKRELVIPYKPDESPLYRSLITKDKKKRMPPETEEDLADKEIRAIRTWIEKGAEPFPIEWKRP